MIKRIAFFGFLASISLGCAAHQVSYVPVGSPPVNYYDGGPCHVEVVNEREPDTLFIGIVRCTDGSTDKFMDLSSGPSCWKLVKAKACEMGGDVVFAAHIEAPTGDFVADVGKLSQRSVTERALIAPR
jgi:hypothetical protein